MCKDMALKFQSISLVSNLARTVKYMQSAYCQEMVYIPKCIYYFKNATLGLPVQCPRCSLYWPQVNYFALGTQGSLKVLKFLSLH